MTHLPGILWVGILLSPENFVYSISDIARWSRLAGSDFSRPSSRPLLHHYFHPHFIPPKCDWWKCPAWPSTVSWRTAEGKDSCDRYRGGARGVEDLNFIDAPTNQWEQSLHLTQYIRAKSSPLTTWCCANQGYNSSGTLGQGQHTSTKSTGVLKKYSNNPIKFTQSLHLKQIEGCTVPHFQRNSCIVF